MPQPHKGDRKAQTVRFPRDQFAVYEQNASALGLPVADYVVKVLAEAHGFDVPEWARGSRTADVADLFGRAS